MTFLRRSWHIAILIFGLAIAGCGLGPRASASWTRSDRTDTFVACHSVLGLTQAQCLCVTKQIAKSASSPEAVSEKNVADAVNACVEVEPEPGPDPFETYA